MKIIGIIPARMESSRFPGKPMANILGMPMIGHVYHRSRMSNILDEVYVATCNKEIYNYIKSINGKPIMTANTHERASDRTAEALSIIEKNLKRKMDIVVMLQGDEPMITPEMINISVKPLLNNSEVQVSNLMTKIISKKEWNDPNEVKVVCDYNNNAIYFSREPIPSNKKYNRTIPAFKQVCIIPFKRNFLLKYMQLNPTPLEIIESVDMNRLIEHGYKIKMIESNVQTIAVDTKQDLKNVIDKIKYDSLIKKYLPS